MIARSAFRATLSLSTLAVALSATPAFAQSAEPSAAEPSTMQPGDNPDAPAGEGIVITGSRIPRPDLDGTSPVTVIGAAEVEQTGTTRVEDLVNSLPQVFAGQSAFISNGASGTATVNLRGLGSSRTLVLVNGRRLQPGDPSLPSADLNQIPAALIQRVDLSTGGASSIYGADAVAGVVNFILNTDFEGVDATSQISFYQHENNNDTAIVDALNRRNFGYPGGNVADGFGWNSNLTVGTGLADGRGHVTAYFGYRQVNPVLQRDRDYSACSLSGTFADGFACGGSSTTPQGRFSDFGISDSPFNFTIANGGQAFRPYRGATDAYNFAPANYFQRPDKRYTAGFFGRYEVDPAAEVYTEFMFMDDRSVAQIAESGTFFADQITLQCNNPLLTATQVQQLCTARGVDPAAGSVDLFIGKRNVEGGPRQDDLRHTSFRGVLGLRGQISEQANIRYDAYLQYGTTIFAETYLNDLSASRIVKALDAVRDPATGNIVCRSALNGTDPACVPYNLFRGQGVVGNVANGITQGALNYISTPGFQRGDTKEYIASGFVSGELGSLSGSDPITLVVGAEYRKEQLQRNVDVAFATGDLTGQGGPIQDVRGKFHLAEGFAEARIPILQDRPGFNNLELDLSGRVSDYSTIGTVYTYAAGGEYSPFPGFKFRGGYNRAVRAPNVIELFSPSNVALFGGTDPCAGATPTFTQAQCANTGVTAAQYGNVAASPANQYNQFIGGNPNLNEEKADTYTAGVVYDGRGGILRGLVLKADYFDIKVQNAISTIGAQNTLNQCGLTGDPQFCSLIVRGPGGNLFTGQTGFVINTNQNIGAISTRGVDVGASYSLPVFGGRLGLDFNGTYLIDLKTDTGIPTTTGDGKFDCVGFHGTICGTPNPKWRHTLRATYDPTDGVGLGFRWRHFSRARLDELSGDPDLGQMDPTTTANIKSYDFFDGSVKFDVGDHYGLTVGVNNILDKQPPIIGNEFGTAGGNTYAETYDPIGRYFFAQARVRF